MNYCRPFISNVQSISHDPWFSGRAWVRAQTRSKNKFLHGCVRKSGWWKVGRRRKTLLLVRRNFLPIRTRNVAINPKLIVSPLLITEAARPHSLVGTLKCSKTLRFIKKENCLSSCFLFSSHGTAWTLRAQLVCGLGFRRYWRLHPQLDTIGTLLDEMLKIHLLYFHYN